jgi:hypothetical protein
MRQLMIIRNIVLAISLGCFGKVIIGDQFIMNIAQHSEKLLLDLADDIAYSLLLNKVHDISHDDAQQLEHVVALCKQKLTSQLELQQGMRGVGSILFSGATISVLYIYLLPGVYNVLYSGLKLNPVTTDDVTLASFTHGRIMREINCATDQQHIKLRRSFVDKAISYLFFPTIILSYYIPSRIFSSAAINESYERVMHLEKLLAQSK